MYGAFDVVLYFVNPTVLVANKLTSYIILEYMYVSTNCDVGPTYLPTVVYIYVNCDMRICQV